MAYVPTNGRAWPTKGKSMADEANDELESTSQPTEEVDKTEDVEEVVPDTDTEDTEKLKESNKRLFERAKKAEAEAKLLKAERLKAEETAKLTNAQPPSPPSPDPDELRLIARGLSDEEIDQAKVISKGKGIPLPEALKDSMFLSFQKDFKEQQKKDKAKLGASKGSGQVEEKSFASGQTEEEHKELWKDTLGKK